jgi:thiamine transport system substrate-binding protein
MRLLRNIHHLLWLVLLGFLAACGDGEEVAEGTVVRLMTHDSFDVSVEVLEAFTAETGIQVEVFKAGDGGEALNKAILSKDAPLADVFYGVDNTYLGRALDSDIFLPYDSPALAEIADDLELDPQNRALPVNYGDVCLNYDVAWFTERDLPPPTGVEALIDPAYAGLTVVQNPATSTPGLAFLLLTIEAYGEDGYLDYWQTLEGNGALVVDGWSEAYYSHFTAASEGDRPIVVSYASSPVAEVYFAEEPPAEAPTAAVVGDGACFRQIEFVGILRGTEVDGAARQFVDFMLSRPFQEDIPLKMFVYPANETATLPEVFVQHSVLPEAPVTMAPERIAANREAWIQAWTEAVLR